ncbi:MAG TPA: serine/threonine-protein kinase, partial [Candidatus Saccharimonadales bacterium]|nr:serine/threonine-protein kinase [Candidatus Saccharimonadales bacterium]
MADPDLTGVGGAGSVGKKISHYELLEILGEGGMGVVFRAKDLSLPREIAMKRPRPADATDPDLHRRFLREGRAMAGLTHPNIVPVYDVFEADGVPWIVMELVKGTSLRTRLDSEGALPFEEVLRISEQLASALGEAHANHVLHRDIKPANVLLGADGRARLSDFGLARYFTAPEDISSTATKSLDISAPGAVAGTSGYMSPEQALGKKLDVRSDVFGLGAVLYEMCTGRRAFEGTTRAQILDAVLNQEPVAIGRLNYEIPEAFEHIVRKCLAKSREDRYPDTRDLIVDLRRLRRGTEPGTVPSRTGWVPAP